VPLSRNLANPLHDIPRDQLAKDVAKFAQEKGLTEHLSDLHKGALLAQKPGGFEGLDVLDEEDRKVIRHERAHKWSHSVYPLRPPSFCAVNLNGRSASKMNVKMLKVLFCMSAAEFPIFQKVNLDGHSTVNSSACVSSLCTWITR
jgi:hypothetical protein